MPRPGFKLPLLHLGFAFTTEQVFTYFDRHHLSLTSGTTYADVSGPDHTERDRGLVLWLMIEGMRRRFGEMCGTKFELVAPFSQDYLAMIVIYNNHDMHRGKFIDHRRKLKSSKPFVVS